MEVAVWEEDREVARAWVAAPSAGRATRQTIPLPPAAESGRTRYTARLVDADDAYPDDGVAPAYANIGHEASVSKIGEEQLFYLTSRGIPEEEAMAMIVRGFIEPIAKELPLEYAVELNRLIELEMEGSVG